MLGCTHYPLLNEKIQEYLPAGVKLISQGEIVADSLADYLQRHQEIEIKCSKTGTRVFYTTDSTEDFDNHATIFLEKRLDHGMLIWIKITGYQTAEKGCKFPCRDT